MKRNSAPTPRFLADESLGLKVTKNLKNLGYNIISIIETKKGLADAEVLTKAQEEKRILITTDKDFGYLVFKQKLITSGVILLRLKKESVENLTLHIDTFLQSYSHQIIEKFSVVTENKIRFKKLQSHGPTKDPIKDFFATRKKLPPITAKTILEAIKKGRK